MLNRPLLRYYGGKYLLSNWIISKFPVHCIYVEPFGGGGSVLCQKAPAPIEVYNDLDSKVVTFFRMLRECPNELIRAIELTPFSREEYELSKQPCDNPIEQSRRLYVRSWQCRGSGHVAKGGSGWRCQSKDWKGSGAVSSWNRTNDLWAFAHRLKQVQIENDDAIAVIKRYDSPKTLFYCDPPYLQNTRSDRNQSQYFWEMRDDDHQKLIDHLNSIQGMAILSGYTNPIYEQLTQLGWQKTEKTVQTNGKTKANECLWLNPKRLQETLPLFKKQPRK